MANTLTQALDSVNEQYKLTSPLWQKIRDCIQGQEAIHARGTAYLPMLSNQNWPDYQNYRARALFFNGTQRVHEALVGLMFAKEPAVEAPSEDIEDTVIDDITLSGENLYSFTRRIAEQVMSVNRVGVLVDFPEVAQGLNPLTVAAAEAMNLRPYMTMYLAEDIMDWRTEKRNNKIQLSYLKLREWKVEVDPENEFSEVCTEMRRVLDFDELGQFRVRTFKRDAKTSEFLLDTDMTPMLNGKAMDVIPFYFFSSKDSTVNVSKPLLIDLAEVNLSHYRSTADYEHGLHFTGLPTAVITGYDAQPMDFGDDTGTENLTLKERSEGKRTYDDAEFSIGSGRAWVLPNADAKAFYLEFQGQGLTQLSTALDRKETQMAKLGARILQNDKNAAESGEALGIRRHAETSVLAATAESITNTMQQALNMLCEWGGIPEIKFTMNLDFIATKMTPEELTAAVNAWLSGAMSKESLFDLLVKGEVLTGTRTFEEEQTLIDEAKDEMVGKNGMDLNDPNGQNGDNGGDNQKDPQPQ